MSNNIQENIKKKIREYLGELAFYVDCFLRKKCNYDFDCYQWLAEKKVKHQHAKEIADSFRKLVLCEIELAYSGECEQLVEGYSFLTRPQLKKFIQFIAKIIDDCNRWADVEKQIATNNKILRVRRPKSPLKQVQNMSFMREHDGLKSIPPTRIVGSKILWVYNVKTRLLGVYVSGNSRGFSVKGTTILNYSENESLGKVLRKPEPVINELLGNGKISPKSFMETIKTKAKKITGRINKETILLRVN